MDQTSRLLAHLPLALLALVSQTGWTQPVRGQLDAQSRASIAIGVSVLPSFQIHEYDRALEVTSNAPTIRYHLVLSPTARGSIDADAFRGAAGEKHFMADEKSAVSHGGDNLLVLVVPD